MTDTLLGDGEDEAVACEDIAGCSCCRGVVVGLAVEEVREVVDGEGVGNPSAGIVLKPGMLAAAVVRPKIGVMVDPTTTGTNCRTTRTASTTGWVKNGIAGACAGGGKLGPVLPVDRSARSSA